MKKTITISISLIVFNLFLFSCNNEKKVKVTNKGKTIVENGKGERDTVDYECKGCVEYIKDTTMLNKVIRESSLRTKQTLSYPLSFIPKKIELTIINQDSLFYFDNNEKIDNVSLVISKYDYIAKNGYGNELEGESLKSFYIRGNKILDIEEDIKLEDLSFDKYINRSLSIYNDEGEFIEFTPTKDKSIILNSSLDCVDEGSILQITLENDDEIKLKSWNGFNCDATSYFYWFNKSQINKLVKSRIKYIFVYSRGNSVIVRVPKNKSDYIQQLINLYK